MNYFISKINFTVITKQKPIVDVQKPKKEETDIQKTEKVKRK